MVDRVLEVDAVAPQVHLVLKALQQEAQLDVRVAVTGVDDRGALAEQSVGLIEEEQGAGPIRNREHAFEVLLPVSPDRTVQPALRGMGTSAQIQPNPG